MGKEKKLFSSELNSRLRKKERRRSKKLLLVKVLCYIIDGIIQCLLIGSVPMDSSISGRTPALQEMLDFWIRSDNNDTPSWPLKRTCNTLHSACYTV